MSNTHKHLQFFSSFPGCLAGWMPCLWCPRGGFQDWTRKGSNAMDELLVTPGKIETATLLTPRQLYLLQTFMYFSRCHSFVSIVIVKLPTNYLGHLILYYVPLLLWGKHSLDSDLCLICTHDESSYTLLNRNFCSDPLQKMFK